jgi:lipopolysaccharide export system protein LptA
MKRFRLILIAAWCGWMVHASADTNTQGSPAGVTTHSPAPPPSPHAPTRIDSDHSADFDLNGHQAIYRGHVRVDDPVMKLTCGLLVADVPQAGGRPNRIVAETNVVIDFMDPKGQTNHATSDKAVYIYNVQNGVTNETVTLTGNPQMENAQGTQAGDVIIWDRANNKIHFDNPRMIFRQNLNGAPANTNSPPEDTNTPVINKTNLPPGTVQNIDKMIQNTGTTTQ